MTWMLSERHTIWPRMFFPINLFISLQYTDFKQITMRYPLVIILIIALFAACNQPEAEQPQTADKKTTSCENKPAYAMVIHGGAGTILRENLTPEKEKAIRDVLNEALNTGETILQNGGSSMDAVIATINVMENSEHFNAGKGAVFTHEGINELDASIMNGENLEAGAVGGVTIVKNPINAARAVMENSKHVMLSGAGANTFAIEQGLIRSVANIFIPQPGIKRCRMPLKKRTKKPEI